MIDCNFPLFVHRILCWYCLRVGQEALPKPGLFPNSVKFEYM